MTSHRILSVTQLTAGTSLIRFTRENLQFLAGQYLLLGIPGGDLREYSIFSRPQDGWLVILVRVIPDGSVSSQLASLVPGDPLQVQGVQGAFVLPPDFQNKRFLFVATGTGIAPFHSIIGGTPQADYQLYHGVRRSAECYARHAFDAKRYHACLSRESGGAGEYTGRVTQVLANHGLLADTACYLCGSCDMIYEMFALLQSKGISRDQIHAETYY
ncbi:MAG: ferredoxin--NADP reductase [Kiritimatiellia bacterium]